MSSLSKSELLDLFSTFFGLTGYDMFPILRRSSAADMLILD